MDQFKLGVQRGGVLLKADRNDPREVEGILNPAVAGDHLLYRAVGKGNYSRIMAARLVQERIDENTVAVTAEKTGLVVMEPSEPYETTRSGGGGVEDPRVTQLVDGQYVMFYTGFGEAHEFSQQTAVVALATSKDGLLWEKLGRIYFAPYQHESVAIDFNMISNKDAVLFEEKVNGKYAMLHRPTLPLELSATLGVPQRCMWYAESLALQGPWETKGILLKPEFPWEKDAVGAGVPPIHIQDAWVHVYHGYAKHEQHNDYSVGLFLTSHDDPQRVLFRAKIPLLSPVETEERNGTVPDVIFPTAVWPLDGHKNSMILFWGGADSYILWGQLHLPKGDPAMGMALSHSSLYVN